MISGLAHVLKTGCRWRAVPEEICLDTTYVKAHRSAQGSKGGPVARGRHLARGGATGKAHGLADARGRPVALALAPGNLSDFHVPDIHMAIPLREGPPRPKRRIADKAHAKVLPHIGEEFAEEAQRRGVTQGVPIEEAWALYRARRGSRDRPEGQASFGITGLGGGPPRTCRGRCRRGQVQRGAAGRPGPTARRGAGSLPRVATKRIDPPFALRQGRVRAGEASCASP